MNIYHMPKAQADPVSTVSFRFVLANKGQCSLLSCIRIMELYKS